MKWYCEKCKVIHMEDELCPIIKKQLKENPQLLVDAANFTTIAGEEVLITSQALDNVANGINKLAGTNLSYEGTQQFARDIQVFKRLNEEAFAKKRIFDNPNKAKDYFENVLEVAKEKTRSLTSFESKLTGYGQEVDWVRMKQSEISSLWQKSYLLDKNAPGVDGVTINRFTGKEINRTTIKASKNAMKPSSTGIKDVQKALNKGTANENDIIFGPKGTKAAANKAGLENRVVEKNTQQQIIDSNKRLEQKIIDGQATTSVTIQQVEQKMLQGAIVGAAVSFTISTITSFVRYKNADITRDEAFAEVSEATMKGTIVGAEMGAVTIFIPSGIIGFVAGMAVGIYLDRACSNVLDEIYGKGAYGAILDASGYVYGMTFNLAKYYEKIEGNNQITLNNIAKAETIQNTINNNFIIFEQMKGERYD